MEEIKNRKKYTISKINEIKKLLKETENLIKGKACIYVTGSFGRDEASSQSDLDLFIAGTTEIDEQNLNNNLAKQQHERRLNRLDEIIVKAKLIEVTRELELPEFDGDGEYLRQHTQYELIKQLGGPADDYHNTFTARLLLLLESKPLIGQEIYDNIIDGVIKTYWRDYEKHKEEFKPTFFVNDVQRLWRTFCVNYEARTRNTPEGENIKRRIKNYKLKHSRLLTCYSSLLCLLAIHAKHKTVHPQDMREIVYKTPLKRLLWIQNEYDAGESIQCLLDAYGFFLRETAASKSDLYHKFENKSTRRALTEEANKFGDAMYRAVTEVGRGSSLVRQLVV